jgi:hypothetical protein
MLRCVEGLITSLLRCFDLDLYKQSRGLEDPELLARETVCTHWSNLCVNIFYFLFDAANGFPPLLILCIFSKQRMLRFYAMCLTKWFCTICLKLKLFYFDCESLAIKVIL